MYPEFEHELDRLPDRETSAFVTIPGPGDHLATPPILGPPIAIRSRRSVHNSPDLEVGSHRPRPFPWRQPASGSTDASWYCPAAHGARSGGPDRAAQPLNRALG